MTQTFTDHLVLHCQVRELERRQLSMIFFFFFEKILVSLNYNLLLVQLPQTHGLGNNLKDVCFALKAVFKEMIQTQILD